MAGMASMNRHFTQHHTSYFHQSQPGGKINPLITRVTCKIFFIISISPQPWLGGHNCWSFMQLFDINYIMKTSLTSLLFHAAALTNSVVFPHLLINSSQCRRYRLCTVVVKRFELRSASEVNWYLTVLLWNLLKCFVDHRKQHSSNIVYTNEII